MDPDAALDELLGLVGLTAREADADVGQRVNCNEILRMAELVEALDSWLIAGGRRGRLVEGEHHPERRRERQAR